MSEHRPKADSATEPTPNPFTQAQRTALLFVLGLFLLILLATSLPWPWREKRVLLERLPERMLDYKIAINEASWAELIQLPEVGPKLAEKILAERETNGPFADAAALERVPGLGPKTIAKILPYLTFHPSHK